ncbi:hypothetical protein GCM10022207_87270 [Streptomyces lannensis]|uniref:Uncharacterized protein n=1 Tax=Streptomyces lannensis TaxID=766498 RepID=A0ABP7LRC2_9ACTN
MRQRPLAGTVLPEIDNLVIKSYPVVAGAGIPAFDPTVFDMAERTAFPNGVTLSRLTRRRPPTIAVIGHLPGGRTHSHSRIMVGCRNHCVAHSPAPRLALPDTPFGCRACCRDACSPASRPALRPSRSARRPRCGSATQRRRKFPVSDNK